MHKIEGVDCVNVLKCRSITTGQRNHRWYL